MAGTNPSVQKLRALLRDPHIPQQDMEKHVKELMGKNDRLLAVVGGSLVEGALRGLLKSKMRNENDTDKRLFGPNAPLSSFSVKIDLAYALKLVDNDTRRNAHYIREIRNVFAHRVAPTSFLTTEVAAVCRLLVIGSHEGNKRAQRSMRARFLVGCVTTGRAIWGLSSLARPATSHEKHH